MTHDHVDVLIVGAGLSGIGAAVHLQRDCPGKTYAILEARESIGGTWDLFRYPGIRSDSDMYTLGYEFKPWTSEKAIADGPDILSYVNETAREHDVVRHIRFNQRAVRASWSTEDARWTVEVEHPKTGETTHVTCGFLFFCSGYYRYDRGYTPEFPGRERFTGDVVHPQHWPEDLDYSGKRVVVIGSGATAVTLVPAMADQASHVTMLQRSPTYIITLPGKDPIANGLRRALPSKAAYAITRWKNVIVQLGFFQISRRRPNLVKKVLRSMAERQLPDGYELDPHFRPTYNPWDQRLCLVPDGDLFKSIRHGKASVVTDHIETFTETGIQLQSGEHLEADVVVTATGLDLQALGGLDLAVDGEDIALNEKVGYKGMMISDIPNMAFALGYTNASWTLKCDLTCSYVTRLINHMDATGMRQCTPVYKEPVPANEPFIDFSSGYVLRALDRFPKQGPKAPWRLHQNYMIDIFTLRRGDLEDGAMEFTNPTSDRSAPSAPTPAGGRA